MRAGLRLAIAASAAGLALAQAPALAQNAAAPATSTPATNTPAPETIGPRELRNFSLPGTTAPTTQQPASQAPPPSAPAPRAERPAPSAQGTVPASQAPTPRAQSPAVARSSRATPEPRGQVPPPPLSPTLTPPAASSQTLALPPATPAASSAFPPSTDEPAAAPSSSGPSPLLWLLLAAVLGGGAALVLWRRRSREALAGATHFDLYAAPEPATAPPPPPQPSRVPVQPLPRAAPPPPEPPKPGPSKPAGVVASRLRPSIDVNFAPLACEVEADRLVLHFDVELFNSGGAPARELLVEVSMFNGGPTQEQDIAAFFARPAGPGERIAAIAPLQRLAIRNSIVAERSNVQLVELGGKPVFVPVVAFSVHYRGSGGEAQTGASFLVGRDTGGDKLGPLQLGSAPRQIAKLAARPLPIAART